MSNIYLVENSNDQMVCKIYGHCSGIMLRKKLQEITLFGLSIFEKQAKAKN